ncbi:hypothetical protein FG386_000029 [Cryptosporidium ryanae]|uniref:uncharacterized protein n=1 Tax=Cryptosporidium ryanae TaxID=515981 RepID=UPI00351A8D85|nr:hypothetical protein FG386_000029 [Cryptosporidium ryanae]
MEFWNDIYSEKISRRAFIPGKSNDEVKEILSYNSYEEPNKQRNYEYFRNGLSSEKTHGVLNSNEKGKREVNNLNGKKYFSHEVNLKKGQTVLKRDLVFDTSAGCCVPIYTRKAGCARMKLDIIDYGRAENSLGFAGIINNACPKGHFNNNIEIRKNFSQHFIGSSTNIIGDVKGDSGLKYEHTSKLSKVNISSMNFEDNYCMPNDKSSDKTFRKIRHSHGENCNGSHLAFTNGFLTLKS